MTFAACDFHFRCSAWRRCNVLSLELRHLLLVSELVTLRLLLEGPLLVFSHPPPFHRNCLRPLGQRWKRHPLFLRHFAFVFDKVEEGTNGSFWSSPRHFGCDHLAPDAVAAETGAASRRALDERSAFATPARLALATSPHVASLRTSAAAVAACCLTGTTSARRPAVSPLGTA